MFKTSALALMLGVIAAGLTGCAEWQKDQQAAQKPGSSAKPGSSQAGKTAAPEPTPAEVARMLEPNVLGISCLYDGFNPWMWNTDHTQVTGVRVGALFLLGPDSTGVFGDGVIHARLFVATRDENGKPTHRLTKEWSFDVDHAMPYRSKRRTKWGWGYALFLPWENLNLAGREVRLTISFERADGVVITGSKKDFRVPKEKS